VFSGVMVSGHTGDLTGDGLLHKCPTKLFFGTGLSGFFRAAAGVIKRVIKQMIKRVIKHLSAKNLRTKMKIKNQKVS
jgi:hypothetical protein